MALTGSRVQGIDDDDAQCVGDAKNGWAVSSGYLRPLV
jgi:hypothetical protein